MTDRESTSQMAAAIGASGKPISVERPARESMVAVFAAMWTTAAVAASVIALLGLRRWPDAVAPDRVKYLAWIGLAAMLDIALLVAALASPWLGIVKASAGALSVEVDGTARNAGVPPASSPTETS